MANHHEVISAIPSLVNTEFSRFFTIYLTDVLIDPVIEAGGIPQEQLAAYIFTLNDYFSERIQAVESDHLSLEEVFPINPVLLREDYKEHIKGVMRHSLLLKITEGQDDNEAIRVAYQLDLAESVVNTYLPSDSSLAIWQTTFNSNLLAYPFAAMYSFVRKVRGY